MDIDVNSDRQSVVVNAPTAELYRRCLRYENLPASHQFNEQAREDGQTRVSLALAPSTGKKSSSVVQIMVRVPDRRITWQAASEYFRAGVVFFDPLAGGTTKVTVKLRSILEPLTLTGLGFVDHLENFKRVHDRRHWPQNQNRNKGQEKPHLVFLSSDGSAAAATPAKSDDPNDVVLTMKESSALIYIT